MDEIFLKYYEMIIKPFKKEWIIFISFIIFIIIISNVKYLYFTGNIADNFKKGEYVGNGLIINNNTLITGARVPDLCKNGMIYADTKEGSKSLMFLVRNIFYNVAVYRFLSPTDTVSDYTIIRRDKAEVGEKLIYRRQRNAPRTYVEVGTKVKAINGFGFIFNDYTINNNINGLFLFNKNYVFTGILSDIEKGYNSLTMFEKLLIKLRIRKMYSATSSDLISGYLTENNIKHYTGSSNVNARENKGSVTVNIICIK